MIKKLKRKFVFTAVLAAATVLFLLMGAIIVTNYINVVKNADERIAFLTSVENGLPADPEFPGRQQENGEEEDGELPDLLFGGQFPGFGGFDGRMNREARFDSRYFTVDMKNGEAVSVDLGRIAAVDEEQAAALAGAVWAKGRDAGFTSVYRYAVLEECGGVTQIFFLDCTRELSTLSSFIWASVLVSFFGLLLILGIALLVSKPALKPVTESYEKQKRFITDASHELKTPLAVIQSAAEVIELTDGESEWTQSIKNQVERLTTLTNKLVLLSRLDESGYQTETREFDLSAAVDEIAESFSAVAVNRGRAYEREIEPGIRMTGDESLIRQLCSLLIDNAMKYTNENGLVRVTLRRNGRNRELTVYNTVDEIRKGPHNELFERFYRADESRAAETGGHGIGLSVAESIVEHHKGRISAVSDDGRSLRFTCIF